MDQNADVEELSFGTQRWVAGSHGHVWFLQDAKAVGVSVRALSFMSFPLHDET